MDPENCNQLANMLMIPTHSQPEWYFLHHPIYPVVAWVRFSLTMHCYFYLATSKQLTKNSFWGMTYSRWCNVYNYKQFPALAAVVVVSSGPLCFVDGCKIFISYLHWFVVLWHESWMNSIEQISCSIMENICMLAVSLGRIVTVCIVSITSPPQSHLGRASLPFVPENGLACVVYY